ncbi:MAG: ABC transporter permease [Bacillota bacterium]
MKLLLKLARKNLFRNKLRTFISIAVITFAVMMVVVLRGFVLGMIDSMFKLHIQYDAGHIKIINQEYERKQRLLSLNYPVDGFNGAGLNELNQELKEINGVEEVIPRIKFGAAVSNKDDLVTMMGWGVKPQQEIEFTEIEDYLVAGRMIKAGAQEIIIGTKLLDKVNVELGEKITIVYNTSWGSFKGSTVEVVGEIESGFKLLDENSFYLPLDQAQKILAMPDMATEVLLEISNYKKAETVMPRIKELIAKNDARETYKVSRWDRGSAIIQYLQVGQKIYNFVYIFVILLACIVVISTMVMIVKERTSEIGMMSALGLKDKEILYLFIMEGMFLGFFGSLLGVISGGVITKILSIVGIDYSAAFADMEADLLIRPMIYPNFSWNNLFFAFIIGTIITTLTAIIPAKKAADLNPTEAIRN